MLVNLFWLLLTYLAAGVVLAGGVRRLDIRIGVVDDEYAPWQALLIGFGTAPALISLILCFLFVLTPCHADSFYLTAVLAVFAVIALLGWRGIVELSQLVLASLRRSLRPIPFITVLAAILAVVLVARICHQAVSLPIHGHDALAYAFVGKYLYKEKSLNNYPMTHPDSETGAVMWEVNHPPGLVGLYAWFHIARGGTGSDVLLRTVAPMYGIFLLALLFLQLRRRTGSAAWALAGVLCLLATPCFWLQCIGNSLDPIRIFYIILAIFIFVAFLKDESLRNLCYFLAALGFAYFMHRASVVWFPLMLVVYVYFSRRITWKKSCFAGMIAIAVVFGIFAYGKTGRLGEFSFVPVKVEDARREFVFSKEWMEKVASGRASWIEVQWQERFQILSRPKIFALTFPLALLGVIFLWRRKLLRRDDAIVFSVCGLYAAAVLFKYYFNYRYISTIAPLACYFISIGAMALFSLSPLTVRPWLRRGAGAALAAATLLAITLFLFTEPLLSLVKARGNRLAVSCLEKIDNFVNWKPRSHPDEEAMIFLRNHKVDPTRKTLFISRINTKKPSFYYYLGGRNVLFFEDTAEWNSLFTGKTDAELKALLNIDFIVLDQSVEEAGVILEATIANLIAKAKAKPPVWTQRGLRIYSFRK